MLRLIVPASASMGLDAAVMISLANSPEVLLKVYVDQDTRSHLRQSLYHVWESLEKRNLFDHTSGPCEAFCRQLTLGGIALVEVDQAGQIQPLLFLKCPGDLTRIGELVRGWDAAGGIARNDRALGAYLGQQPGETGIIIGTGPSLMGTDLRKLARFPTIGCNKLFLLDKYYFFRPTFLLVEDRLILEDHGPELANYSGTQKLFPYDFYGSRSASAFFPLWRSYPMYPRFSTDLRAGLYSGWSVTFLLLQFAFCLGWRRIILLGIDGNTSPPAALYSGNVGRSVGPDSDHFDSAYYGPGARFHKAEPERVETAYRLAHAFLADEGVEVWNCSPGTRVRAFPTQTLGAVLE